MARFMIIRKGASVMAALIGVAGTSLLPIASADTLSNGLTVDCKPDSDTHATCIIGGCPRVNGDYVVDAVHVILNGGLQNEYGFKCINGETVRYGFDLYAPTVDDTIGVQGCRKNTLSADWCGPWADYHFKRAPQPAAAPAPAPAPVPAPAPAPVPVPAPAAAPVTNAIKANFDPPGLTKVVLRVENSSNLPGACHYDAKANTNNPLVPKNTTRDFTVPANGKTAQDFPGAPSGTTYTVTITCKDASGKQTQDIGDQNLTLKW